MAQLGLGTTLDRLRRRDPRRVQDTAPRLIDATYNNRDVLQRRRYR